MLFIPLFISLTILCISIYIELNLYNSHKSNEFILSLESIDQEILYKKYISEKLILYFQGQILGFIIAMIAAIYLQNYNILIFPIIILLSSLLYTTFYPINTNILDYLTTPNQNILWRYFEDEKDKKKYLTLILNLVSFCIIGKLIKNNL